MKQNGRAQNCRARLFSYLFSSHRLRSFTRHMSSSAVIVQALFHRSKTFELMRFITKWGEKGIICHGKLVPALGGAIGGAFDFASTRIIGNRVIKLFADCKEFYG